MEAVHAAPGAPGAGRAVPGGRPAVTGAVAARSDGGFTLAEVIVSIGLISVVMGALTTFFVSSLSAVRVQGSRQVAVQLAADGVERVRRLDPTAVIAGRDSQSVNAQWANPVPGVDLSGMQKVHDGEARNGAGASATLSTTYETVTVNGIPYRRYWYAGLCWQPRGGGDCTAVEGYAQMYRVIVAVTWTDHECAATGCRYVTSTLISSKFPDPLYNVNGA